ncbi:MULTISPECIES: Hcp family type VI secretion system effector [Pseudomonas]|nr:MULTISPECIES: type VI secretion system tube protein Hcp [Pseudomonas]AHZ79617.1 type VI secretion system effector [Pseudomonas putida]AJG17153.1 Hcp1 family type VI secretion system effector [Pseudomonas plecoglossicida]KAF4561982.1 type VI secretion system tube protein Hcp [Pseudomonas sp. CES]MBF8786406.1 type VI secretion system tube protein Hcp [Pseudomonas asiatica]MBF8802750.1 type VI secretion system tube protein Hcp [Pseudomonas asiatica]
MAFDAYIQIAEITGEALDEQYANWIEIIGYKFGANQSTSATASSAGGASSGRTTLTNFTFTKYLDSASCKLLEASCAGQHLKEVKLVVCRAGTEKLKYYEVVLEEVIIADYAQSANAGVPVEVVQLNYGRIKTTYTRQKRLDGSAGGNVTGGWDRISNKKYA